MILSIVEQMLHFECEHSFFSFNLVSSFQALFSMLFEPRTWCASLKANSNAAHFAFHVVLEMCVILPG